ncbi:MAG: phosphoribosylanthranilate isomerase [Robiginitomaculum sp.]|nr:MAG: phosphoribosylanthranilate isomerase [Robiginitomaculum sp.]
MVRVKICGLTEPAGVRTALDAGADYLGFVFAQNSPRTITPAEAAALAEPARGKVKIVAVLVNPGDKQVKKVVDQLAPDFIQLHGRETPERVRTLWKRYHIPVIKSFSISSARDVTDTNRYAHTASMFLLDAKAPKDTRQAGGHGLAFDWRALLSAKLDKPWILAGGLTPDNVAKAIAQTHARVLDVSTGVESAPGIKDAQKIAAFMLAAKQTGEVL